MKKINIKYNPFKKSTVILVNGKSPKKNSSLNFGEQRLQEWAGELPSILSKEYADKNFEVEFTGNLADFEDLKFGFSSSDISVKNYKHNRTPDVSEVEVEVERIFKEIMTGSVPQLKDKAIIDAFEKAKNKRFEINVVATMSSGKSTLINSLLDHKLMPVANEPTTATIVSIIDTDIDNYKGIAYDASGAIIDKSDDLTYTIMQEWNNNTDISQIDIEGRIPCVNSIGMRLVLVDTPGPNNAANQTHRSMTYEMLEDSEKSLVLFVMRADNMGVDDESAFLDHVCETMQKGGKQSRDRYLFAINKIDEFNPEEESIEDALKEVKRKLESKGIFNPNIFPVSAQAAFEARTKPKIKRVISYYRDYIKYYPSSHYDNYYQFSHLPNIARLEIEKYIQDAQKENDEFALIELHSGIVSIEKAIELYINKYSKAIKVYDLVKSFNSRLKELAAVAQMLQKIQDDSTEKDKIEASIASIREKINSGESARVLSSIVDKTDLKAQVQEEIDKYLDSLSNRINDAIFKYTNYSKVKKSEAEKQIKDIESESKDILSQLTVQINKILKDTYKILFSTIVTQYQQFVEQLGLDFGNDSFILNPIDLVARDIGNLSEIMNQNTKAVRVASGSHTEYRTEKVPYLHVKTNWFWKPSTWYTYRTETRYRVETKAVKVTDYTWEDYVNMSEVVNIFFEPIQLEIQDAKRFALKHVTSESKRIKNSLKKQLKRINGVLEEKLKELHEKINDANTTAEEIETQKRNLEWMKSIIKRINKLINY